MENLIPWILGICGGVVCLLGWLWFSAERDLTKKGRETESTHSEKEKLAAEIANLKQSLLDKEARLNEAANQNQEVSSQQSRLQNDIAELRHKLDESQSKIVELGGAKQTLIDLQASGGGNPAELLRLNERIAALEQELAGDQAKLRELDRMRERLAEGERIRQALREENRRHQDQLAHWRQRIVESEESEKRLTLIQEQFGELLTMQAALAESQRRFQDALVAFTRLMDTPTKAVVQTVTFEQFTSGGEPPSAIGGGAFEKSLAAAPPVDPNSVPSTKPQPVLTSHEAPVTESSPKRGLGRLQLVPKPGLRAVRAIIVVSMVGIIGVIFLFSMLNRNITSPRVIRVAPARAIATENQPPANTQSSGVVTSDDAVKPE